MQQSSTSSAASASSSASTVPAPVSPAPSLTTPTILPALNMNSVVLVVVGMAGSGKTSFVQRLNAYFHEKKESAFFINLDPAVLKLPFTPNVDIRDSINYKGVMKQYALGPNGAILTSLNLYATCFDQVMQIVERRAAGVRYFVVDTPGQIEVFNWSASGGIMLQAFAMSLPTVLVYVTDLPRATSPPTFMANMLYACSLLYKSRLPLLLALNKCDVVDGGFALDWLRDYSTFQAALEADSSYASGLTRSMALVLDEFYEHLAALPVSAVTGAGIPEFLVAVDAAKADYARHYRADLERRVAARAAASKPPSAADAAKTKADLRRFQRDFRRAEGDDEEYAEDADDDDDDYEEEDVDDDDAADRRRGNEEQQDDDDDDADAEENDEEERLNFQHLKSYLEQQQKQRQQAAAQQAAALKAKEAKK